MFTRAVSVALILCALVTPSRAQQPREVDLKVNEDQARLVVAVLKQVRCDTVEASLTCDDVKALLRSLLPQLQEQLK